MAGASSRVHTERDLQIMADILKDMGVTEYEPRVLHMMCEFGDKYLKTILNDAFVLSTHAKKKHVDNDDVKLAMSLYDEKVHRSKADMDAYLEIVRQRNSIPLPEVKPALPNRYFSLKSGREKSVDTASKLPQSSKLSSLGSERPLLGKMKKPRFRLVPASSINLSSRISKPAAVSMTKSASTPSIKFSDGKTGTTTSPFSPTISSTANSVHQMLRPEEIKVENNFPSVTTVTEQLLMPTKNQFLAAASSLSPSVPRILMPEEIKVETEEVETSEQPLMTSIEESLTASSQASTVMPEEIKVENDFLTIKPTTEQLLPTIGKSLTTVSPIFPTVSSTANSASSNQLLMSTYTSTAQIQLPTTVTPTDIKLEREDFHEIKLENDCTTTTASGQLLMPTRDITSWSTPQIPMATVSPTDIELGNVSLLDKIKLEKDDSYEM